MSGEPPDLPFPECCVCCPNYRPADASCSHEYRQALISELKRNGSCSVYRVMKTQAMRELSDATR